LKGLKPKAKAIQERKKLLEKAMRWRILDEKFFPEEATTLHRFTPQFQTCLDARIKSMKENGETRFDEKIMGEIITNHLHYNNGYNSDEIKSLFREKIVFKEDGRDLYELCSLLIIFMTKVYEEGLDYTVDGKPQRDNDKK
jgi:hypothetical protein